MKQQNTTKGSKFYNNRNFQIKERSTFGHTTEALLSGLIKPTYKIQAFAFVRRGIGPMNVEVFLT